MLPYNSRKELTPEEFENWFGFLPSEPLSKDVREKSEQINKLFDAMQQELNMGSLQIFETVYREAEVARARHSRFLREVADCPEAVTLFCQSALRQGSLQRASQTRLESLMAGDTSNEARIGRARVLKGYLAEIEEYLRSEKVAEALDLVTRMQRSL